jgi:hypothetical protein
MRRCCGEEEGEVRTSVGTEINGAAGARGGRCYSSVVSLLPVKCRDIRLVKGKVSLKPDREKTNQLTI